MSYDMTGTMTELSVVITNLPRSRRDWYIHRALTLLDTPYRWGGDDPLAGMDCSGLHVLLGQEVGILPPGFDATSAGLYRKYLEEGRAIPAADWGAYFNKPGCLVFYSRSTPEKIHHVGIVLSCGLTIEAGGGGSKTQDRDDAARHNAYVRIWPMDARKNVIRFYADPFKAAGTVPT